MNINDKRKLHPREKRLSPIYYVPVYYVPGDFYPDFKTTTNSLNFWGLYKFISELQAYSIDSNVIYEFIKDIGIDDSPIKYAFPKDIKIDIKPHKKLEIMSISECDIFEKYNESLEKICKMTLQSMKSPKN